MAPVRSSRPGESITANGPFAGSTLQCTGTPYAAEPCNCIYHILTRAFKPTLPDRPTRQLRAVTRRRTTTINPVRGML
jgi:hypothetical protein